MKKALFGLLFIATAVQAGMEKDAYEKYDMTNLKTDQSLIKIVTVDDVKAACNRLRVSEGLKPFTFSVEACSVWPKDGSFKSCTVYIGKKTNNDILGHEIRHCFVGNFH
jgi:hypothetical protein